MTRTPGMWRDPRSGIFYIRRKIPLPLRAAFNTGEFYKLSLETSDPNVAAKRFAIANGEYEGKLQTFRDALAHGGNGRLDLEEARSLVTRHLTGRSSSGFASGGLDVAFILRDLDDAVAEIKGRRTPTAKDMSPGEWIAYRRRMAASDADGELSDVALARIDDEHTERNRNWGERWFDYHRRSPRRRWRPLLTGTVTTLKLALRLDAAASPGIDEPLADAIAEALANPELRHQLPLAPSARRVTRSPRFQPDMKLGELLARWNAARAPRPKSLAAARKAVDDFVSYIGDIGIGEISADDCFSFRDAVATMPRSMPRAHRRLTFVDACMLYAHRTDLERIAPPSIKKYLGAMQALLGYAFQERFLAANPSAGIKVEGYGKKSNRRPFTTEELTRLFAAPIFTQPWSARYSRSAVSDMTLRWLFLLGLTTGARIEELGQVHLTDIKQEAGVWYVDVDDYMLDEDGVTKSVKNDGSTRILPIHPRLIELGFLDYVAAVQGSDSSKLFPDLKADKLSVQTKEASRRAARLIDTVVSTDPRLVFHSFRHSFKDTCRDADLPKDVREHLTGLAPADVGGGYGLGRAVIKLHRHLRKLEFSAVDWDSLKRASDK